MEVLLFWGGLSVVVAVAANSRGRSPIGWFVLSVVISPLIAGLLVLALGGPKSPAATYYDPDTKTLAVPNSDTKKCPECAEIVKADARICRFCRHEFNAGSSISPSPRGRLPLALTSRTHLDS